ncbi:MAG TPA: LacI family DNA-binding transcriptional regulator [Ktedonobacterales bacterium]|nr:LacI family DNA-binding transcriptional regulator [Ktedonobacterales bacterium]
MATYQQQIPATSRDVARRVGVSQSAVSLVFGGKASGRVSDRTRDAILRAARELGYHPNRAARTLRSGQSRLIALAVPDVSNPYFASVLEGVERAARQRDYSVMLASVRDERDWQQVVLDALAARSVDGFLLFTIGPPTQQVRAALRGRAVMVDANDATLPSLRLDIEGGMRAALSHLLQLGHTRIGHLAAAVDAETFHLRRQTYLDVLRAAGHVAAAAYHERTPFDISNAHEAAHRLLNRPDAPTAIVCDSDMLAVGVYKAARDLRRRIPQDLSVVSFDDSILAHILDPELTTVAISTSIIGEQACLLLLGALETGQVPEPRIVPLELMIRESTTTV